MVDLVMFYIESYLLNDIGCRLSAEDRRNALKSAERALADAAPGEFHRQALGNCIPGTIENLEIRKREAR